MLTLRPLHLAILCLALMAPATSFPAQDMDLPTMPEASVVDIAPLLRINGTPTRIREFHIERPLAEVLDYYRDWFGPRRVENDVLGWRVIAHKTDRFLFTLRARAAGPNATVGTLATADLEAGATAQGRPLGLPLPHGSRITSDLEMTDPGKQARLLAIDNAHSMEFNAGHFRSLLERRGYRLEHDLPTDTDGYRGRSMFYSAPGREAIVVIVNGGKRTTVTLNLIQQEEGLH